jgi:hypothetical protein
MTLSQFVHPPDCTGCPTCSELALAILRNPANPILREAMGRPALRTLAERELRLTTAITDDKAALTRAIEARLKRVSPGFMRVVAVDAEKGIGTYEERVNGKTITSKFTFELDGEVVVLKTASANPYERAIAKQREREATPESRFAAEYATDRLAAFADEYNRAEADDATRPAPRVMSAAQRAEVAPPNGYQLALDAMKKESTR